MRTTLWRYHLGAGCVLAVAYVYLPNPALRVGSLVLVGTYDPSSLIEAGWLVSYALWGGGRARAVGRHLTDRSRPLAPG